MTIPSNLTLVRGLPTCFRICAPDQALPDILPRPRQGEFDGSIELEDLRDRDVVLIRAEGDTHVRISHFEADGQITFRPSAGVDPQLFPTFSTATQQVGLLAILTYVVAYARGAVH